MSEELLQGLHNAWQIQVNTSGKDNGLAHNETVMGMADGNKFQGICYKCRQWCHRTNKCPNSSPANDQNKIGNGGKKKFKGSYNLCGKPGHMARDCWSDSNNKDKAPENWKKKTKRAVGHTSRW